MNTQTNYLSFAEQITNEDHKQNLNLNPYAWNIIINDTVDFSSNVNSPINLTSFLNKIIINCEENPSLLPFPSNVSAIANQKQKNFYSLLSSTLPDSQDSLVRDAILKQLMLEYTNETSKYLKKHTAKGSSQKFRLSNKAYDLICSVPKDDFKTIIFKKPGIYLKVLFEEYSLLPPSEREKIFFYDIISKNQRAIEQKQDLLITTVNKKYDVIPYKLTTDTYLSHLYLAGKSCPHPDTDKFVPASFRISRIEHLELLGHSGCLLSKSDAKLLDKRISELDIQFLLSDSVKIKIQFTKEGFQKYQTQSYLRPAYTEKIANSIYEFQITKYQAIAYFFKFGKDVEILEPEDLRTYFKSEYAAALQSYS